MTMGRAYLSEAPFKGGCFPPFVRRGSDQCAGDLQATWRPEMSYKEARAAVIPPECDSQRSESSKKCRQDREA